MSYYSALGLSREPFSTSPDPDFFYHAAAVPYSTSHHTALRRLEIAVRLRRGLSLITGDVGTGKTTLLRALIREFKDDEDILFHMMLDAAYESAADFLARLAGMFGVMPCNAVPPELKDAIEKYLFQKGVEESKIIVLLIDEGQKLSVENLELLRTLLNYETNEYKLLQLVIMAQVELLPRIRGMRNFFDRISLHYALMPLQEAETAAMIEYRLRQAGYARKERLFTGAAAGLIHAHTSGYPRRIIKLCHEALKFIIMHDMPVVDDGVIRRILIEDVSLHDCEQGYLAGRKIAAAHTGE